MVKEVKIDGNVAGREAILRMNRVSAKEEEERERGRRVPLRSQNWYLRTTLNLEKLKIKMKKDGMLISIFSRIF